MMKSTPQSLLRIKQEYPNLSGNYKVIADYILEGPQRVVTGKVRDIALACSCDDAQIIRFCQKLGFDGYSALKTSLATDFLPVSLRRDHGVPDSFSHMKEEFLSLNMRVFQDTVNLLKEDDLTTAINILVSAKRICLIGKGSSGLVAQDSQIKLLRLGLNALFLSDDSFSRMLPGLLDSGDAMLAISFSGETVDICETAAAARERGAKVIGITNYPSSSLTKHCDAVLLTASDENKYRLGAMNSRLAQLMLIDFLMINLALKIPGLSGENILRTHEMLTRRNAGKK